MNTRTIIQRALSRLNISQPNPEQLKKGSEAMERFYKELSSNPGVNTNLKVKDWGDITVTTTADADVNKITITGSATIIGLIDNMRCKMVDILTWYDHREDTNLYSITQAEDDSYTLYHKFVDKGSSKVVYREDVSFGLGDTITLPAEFLPLAELYICREMARTAEQYNRYTAEYEKALNSVIGNRITFVAPTRDVDVEYWGRSY